MSAPSIEEALAPLLETVRKVRGDHRGMQALACRPEGYQHIARTRDEIRRQSAVLLAAGRELGKTADVLGVALKKSRRGLRA